MSTHLTCVAHSIQVEAMRYWAVERLPAKTPCWEATICIVELYNVSDLMNGLSKHLNSFINGKNLCHFFPENAVKNVICKETSTCWYALN